MDRDLIVRVAACCGIADRDPLDIPGPVDEALRVEEADRQLRLVARRAHRDRHVDRGLAGAAGADRHRLLAGEVVVALIHDAAADHGHADGGRLVRCGPGDVGHRGLSLPGRRSGPVPPLRRAPCATHAGGIHCRP